MSKIHLIGGEKGGVGKSVVARVVAQYLIDKSIPFLGFDTDRSHGSLLRFYADYASPVVVDRYESLDTIVEAATENPDKRILVDLAAQTHDPLVRWMDDSGVLETADELGLSFHYWHVAPGVHPARRGARRSHPHLGRGPAQAPRRSRRSAGAHYVPCRSPHHSFF